MATPTEGTRQPATATPTEGPRQPAMTPELVLFPGPQIFSPVTTRSLMRNVLVALAPALVAGVVLFGLPALVVIATSVVSCVVFEWLWCRLRRVPATTGDLSAAVTGALLACCVPPTLPPYMVVVGAFIAVILVKGLFGGIGRNFANPAVVGRIALSVAFPAAMTTYVAPQVSLATPAGVDVVAGATVLAPSAAPLPTLALLVGTQAGTIGETSALAILLGLVWLLATRTITWHVPVTYVASLALFAWATGHDPVAQVLSGGLLLGAVFMATDYATSPATASGKVVFGVGLALVTGLIRFWGNMNEGVAYAILLMNLLVPYIDYLTAARPLGAPRRRGRLGRRVAARRAAAASGTRQGGARHE